MGWDINKVDVLLPIDFTAGLVNRDICIMYVCNCVCVHTYYVYERMNIQNASLLCFNPFVYCL